MSIVTSWDSFLNEKKAPSAAQLAARERFKAMIAGKKSKKGGDKEEEGEEKEEKNEVDELKAEIKELKAEIKALKKKKD
jgi:uncharacterized protein YlxW (UPF0749 family)